MKTTTETKRGRAALMVAHCAGMVDLVALPVWVGTLMASYRLDPQQAGGLVTLFLLGAVVSSLFFAPRLQRMDARLAATVGFAASGLAFLGVGMADAYAAKAVLHLLAGIAAACALSFTHGTIARSERPHRLFALVGMALGIFGVLFMGITPKLVQAVGGAALFQVFGGVMLLAALVSAFAFPQAPRSQAAAGPAPRISGPVWFGALGISCMAIVQAMMFSFLERIGADRGYGVAAVTGVLIALGLVNLFPAPLAALLEKRLSARKVMLCGPIAQLGLTLLMTQGTSFVPYVAGALFFAAVMIFTHTFAFGLIASLDPTGRALAATPAMLMIGAAIGPILGGTLVKMAGYESLGAAVAAIAVVAVFCFSQARPRAALGQVTPA